MEKKVLFGAGVGLVLGIVLPYNALIWFALGAGAGFLFHELK